MSGRPVPPLGWFAFVHDLCDDDSAAVAGRIAAASAGSVNLALTYHSARDVLPGNPRRRLRYLDGGRYFFRPDRRLYAGSATVPLVDPEVVADDRLPAALGALDAAGLAMNAWVVLCHDPPLRPPHEQLSQRNAFGDPMLTDLCPANPQVRRWAIALIRDVSRLRPEAVLIEAAHFGGLRHGYHHERYLFSLGQHAELAMSLCFCGHCAASAAAAGIDVAAARGWATEVAAAALAGLPAGRGGPAPPPGADLTPADLTGPGAAAVRDLIGHRADIVTALAADLTAELAARGIAAVFVDPAGGAKGYSDGLPGGAPAVTTGWRYGVDAARISAAGAAIEILGYARSTGRVRADLAAYRAAAGPGARLRLALRPDVPDCDGTANLAAKLDLARRSGVAAIDAYHFGLVTSSAHERVRLARSGGGAAGRRARS